MACPIILCLSSDAGYFLEFFSCRSLTGRFQTISGENFFQVASPPELAGQLLRCRAPSRGQYPDLIRRQNTEFRLSGFPLGRCFHVTGASSVRHRLV